MAIEAVIDGRLWVNSYDLSGYANEMTVNKKRTVLDATNFDSGGWDTGRTGLKSVEVLAKGFLDYTDDASDEAIRAALDATTTIISIAEDDEHGSECVLNRLTGTSVANNLKVGQLGMYDVAYSGASGPAAVTGKILVAKTTAGAGASATGLQLGAVSATQSIHAALHVFACTGTLTCTLESDDNSDFSSATTRATFTAATGATVEWKSVAGAITDDYWRITYTLPSDSATFAVTAGII